MNSLSPSIEFINAKTGKVLPYDEDGIQYTKQYQEFWRVRVNGNYQGKVYLDSSPLFSLEQVSGKPNEWQIPNFQKSKIENERKRVTGSGYINAILIDNNECICEKILVISPGNLTEEEFNQMIKEIGQLALSAVSCSHHSMGVGQSEKVGIEGIGQQWHPGNGLIMRATALLELYQVIKNHWPLLEKRSLKSLVKEITHIRIDKIHQSPQALIKAKLEPHKKMILGFNNIESNNCSENEFICYLLDFYLAELSIILIDSLKSLNIEEIDQFSIDYISSINSITPRENTNFTRDSASQIFQTKQEDLTNMNRINQERRKRKEEVAIIIKQLKECANWSKQARKSKFLQGLQTPKNLPNISSRLQGASGYGSIFAKFSNSLGGVLKPIETVIYLLQHTYEGRIKTTNELYEIWCFIKLYTAFIVYVNMKPVNNTFLFDKIKITNNEVTIPKIQYILQFNHDTNCHLAFWYDTEVTYNHNGNQGYKRPDIRIELLYNNQKIKQFCFDAKYKNYSDLDIGRLIDDVLGIARDNYYSLLQSKASFLLHTDQKIDYWGERPLTRLSRIKPYIIDNYSVKGYEDKRTGKHKTYELISNVETDPKGYCGHRYGAIFLRPNENSEKQIKRILRLILQYHCCFESLCPSCGHQGKEKPYSQSVGRCYSCENCQEFWVMTHCQDNNHHPLVKFKDSFHQKSNPNSQQWLYDCPVCGDQFALLP